MSKFQQALDAGYTKEEIRDRLLEKNSDKISNAIKAGYTTDEIFTRYEEKYGLPKSLVMGDNTDKGIDTQGFSETDKLKLDISQQETDNHIEQLKQLDDTPSTDLAIKKAKLKHMELQDELIAKNKPIPGKGEPSTNKPTDYGKEAKTALTELNSPFLPAEELALNYLEKVGTTIGGTVEDAFNYITGSNVDYYDKQRKRVKAEGEQLNKSIDPNDNLIVKPTEAISAMAATAIPSSNLIKAVGTATGLGYIEGYSDKGSVKEGLQTGAEYGATTAIGGKAIEKVANKVSSPYSPEALELQKRIGMSDKALKEITNGVPKEDQALAITDATGSHGGGYQLSATKGKAVAEHQQLNRLTARADELATATGKGDIDNISKATDDFYEEMKQMTKKSDVIVNGKEMLNDLNNVRKIGAIDDVIDREIKSMRNQLKDNPNLTLNEMIEFRQKINKNLTKVKGKDSRAYDIWNKLKSNIDDKIKYNAPKEQQKFVKKAIDSYSRTAKQKELIDIIESNTIRKASKGTGADTEAVDWNKAYGDIKKAKLDSPETKASMSILSKYGKKYGNDFNLFKEVTGLGEGGRESFFIIPRVIGWMDRNIRIWTEDHKTALIQGSIEKSIRKSKNEFEFAVNLVANKNTPKAISNAMLKNLKNMKKLNKQQKQIVDNIAKGKTPQNDTRSIQDRITSVHKQEKLIQKQIDAIKKDNPDIATYKGYDGQINTINRATHNKLKVIKGKKNRTSEDKALISKHQEYWDDIMSPAKNAKSVDEFVPDKNTKQQQIDALEKSIEQLYKDNDIPNF